MAHCPPALLTDLSDLLADVRTWPGVVEKQPAIFYLRRAPTALGRELRRRYRERVISAKKSR